MLVYHPLPPASQSPPTKNLAIAEMHQVAEPLAVEIELLGLWSFTGNILGFYQFIHPQKFDEFPAQNIRK